MTCFGMTVSSACRSKRLFGREMPVRAEPKFAIAGAKFPERREPRGGIAGGHVWTCRNQPALDDLTHKSLCQQALAIARVNSSERKTCRLSLWSLCRASSGAASFWCKVAISKSLRAYWVRINSSLLRRAVYKYIVMYDYKSIMLY